MRLGLEARQGLNGVCTEWVIGFFNFPHLRHSIGALGLFVQTLYRLLIGRELARNYIDRTTRRCNLRLGLESRQGLYGVFTNSVI